MNASAPVVMSQIEHKSRLLFTLKNVIIIIGIFCFYNNKYDLNKFGLSMNENVVQNSFNRN